MKGNDWYEYDIDIILMLLECLLLLCQSKPCRQEMRRRKVYPIIRNLDNIMENESINSVVYELVDFLMRDEEVE